MRNALIHKIFSAWKGLAWRLLHDPLGIVRDAWLYGLVIYGVGCIVPTPLDAQPPPPNYAPVLLEAYAKPSFGPVQLTRDQVLEVHIGVEDPDISLPTTQDELHARIFLYDPPTQSLQWLETEATFSAPQAGSADPNLWQGTFPLYKYCLGPTAGTYLFYVVVADRNFQPPPNDSMVVNGGLSTSNHWDVTCQ